ncbi:type II CRISPR-associated endonuclease Cas1 [Limosilactobacillus walteri]|uniref:CRISPR-associated endonuclease Cas1 n=1 Tax=Limosilactobacillus walteri TaxID=2268022 RepID=A0ABR8P7U8_9LACO|nr:type II CRISPR-associated endonuclease Cas1 [Limosilactobacillus walteri]MBD5806795.1 type II CRISPR-associated endonuclease Cas1 [Limosilactobacillus walteri]
MGWRSVIVTQHAKLSYTSHLMVVQTNDGINQIPIDDIELLLVSTTQAVITSALLSELAKRETKVIFVDNTLQPVCETVNCYPNNRSFDLIEEEFKWSQHLKEILWTKIVAAKLLNQLQVLDIYGHDISQLSDELNKLEINDETNREAVVARKYFPLLFENPKFSRRSMTAVNAALNYGYSILLSMVNRAIVAKGYLTCLGIHHRSNENQFNLGSDLMEPFRPIIDYWVANQNFSELTPDVKYGLIDALNLEITFNDKKMLLRNAITSYISQCLNYLSGKSKEIKIEMKFNHEVPNNALINHV